MTKDIVLVQVSMGDYRDTFMRVLLERLDAEQELTLYVGERYFGGTTRTSDYIAALACRKRARNLLYKSKIGLQLFNYRHAIRADVTVLELNPRLLNSWLVLLARQLLGRRTVLWGHAWPRAGRGHPSDRFRARMRDRGADLLLYTATQRAELEEFRAGKDIEGDLYVAPNALYQASAVEAAEVTGRNILYVGRLVPSKKPLVLLEGFEAALATLPDDVMLDFVGDGPEMAVLQGRLDANRELAARVRLHGHVSDRQALRERYADSLFSVSPGYVGLSATQSLSFGRPMLISRDEPHAPEITAMEEDHNCAWFNTDDTASLSSAIKGFYRDEVKWVSRFEQIAERCRDEFSIEAMVAGFLESVNGRDSVKGRDDDASEGRGSPAVCNRGTLDKPSSDREVAP